MADALIKKGNSNTDTHKGRTPREDESRDWEDASTDQGRPKVADKPPEARREARNRFSLRASGRTSTPDILTFTSSLHNRDNTFLLFKLPHLWHLVKVSLANSYSPIPPETRSCLERKFRKKSPVAHGVVWEGWMGQFQILLAEVVTQTCVWNKIV